MGKMYKKIIGCILGLLCIAAAVCVGFMMGSRHEHANKPARERTFYASVETIGENALTVQGLDVNDINKRGRFQLTLSEKTEMEWNYTPIILSDLKPGSRISITYTGDITETEPAGISEVTRIILLEDALDHLPRLVFRDAYVTAYASISGYNSTYTIELDYEDICAIWGVPSLPDISTIPQGAIWKGKASFYEDGAIAIVELMAYNSPMEMKDDVALCQITLRPGALPMQTAYFNDETPTCTLWDIPVTALSTGFSYHGGENMAILRLSEYYLRFMTNGANPIGVEAQFYAPDGRIPQTKELMNRITGYCLDPESTFSLDAIAQKVPDPWQTDSSFTQYIPRAFDDYHLQLGLLDTENDATVLLLSYTETDTGAGDSLRWIIKKCTESVATVDLNAPESYDLRLNDTIDSTDIHSLGLHGERSEEEINTLANPVFAIEDLTEDIVAGRIFEKFESYYPEPYIQLSVLYPDRTVIEFSGHWDPSELYKLLTALPSTDDAI